MILINVFLKDCFFEKIVFIKVTRDVFIHENISQRDIEIKKKYEIY